MDLPRWIEANQTIFTDLSDKVWGFAELGYKEVQSSQLLISALEREGFIASYSRGEQPVIAVLGEFDALPGLSQDCVPFRKPLVNGAPGHGCGHNLLGVAGIATCFALKKAMEAGDLKGSIRYYGCPAEEGGAAKAFMAKAGLFNDVDICLTWHPDAVNSTSWGNFLTMGAVPWMPWNS
jgi:aminobenzoyl-glutamate utilization protein B